MQSKGAIKFFAVMLAIACAFQLSFTFIANGVNNKAELLPAEKRAVYLDSMKNEVVYDLGFVQYTYSECLEKEINLGLDLRGGMNVTLQIAIEDILRALAGSNANNPEFVAALDATKAQHGDSQRGFLELFYNNFTTTNPDAPLAAIFANSVLSEQVNYNTPNAEVLRVLDAQCQSAIENSFNVLNNRINRFGITQPNIQKLGNSGRILVELPGVKDPGRVRKLLQGTANLEFWGVHTAQEIFPKLNAAAQIIERHEALNTATVEKETTAAESTPLNQTEEDLGLETTTEIEEETQTLVSGLFAVLQPSDAHSPIVGYANSYDTVKVNQYLNMPEVKSLFRDVNFMWSVKAMGNSNVFELYAINRGAKGTAPLDGADVADANGEFAQNSSRAEVSMVMTPSGAKKWAQLTKQNVGRFIAIVLDDFVYSCPGLEAEITGGRSSISGNFTISEANDLANVLKSGKLPAPARIIQDEVVGPTLGQESIDAGVSSFILAFALVLLYMIFFYSKAGLVSCIALIANLFFLFGVLVSFGAVLTLPGIAGIVLTMGMAVDANVIIYERIKEELKAGKGFSTALTDGFKNALSAIVDGNATTLITGIVLYVFGSGPVQGFATTLIIGIMTSLFCAIFITRLILDGIAAKGKVASFSNKLTRNFLANTKINFIGLRKPMYVLSGAVFLAVIVSLSTRGVQYGVDFSGGRTYVVRFDQQVSANQVREQLQNVFDDGLEVKQFGTDDQFQMRITTQYKYADSADGVTDEINDMMYTALSPLYAGNITEADFTTTENNPLGIISAEKVGPSIANETKQDAVYAVIFALIVIGFYIAVRFRNWQYSVGGVVSLVHDALITIGMFSMLYTIMPFDLTVDQAFIAAILTIIGYSINDTVVIFDRIRENVTLFPKRSLKENMNNALNQTLARTINTAGTTTVVLLAMFLFGGEVIRGFVFALLFGVIIGTFSSLFIATPIAYDLLSRKKNKQQ